MRLSLIREALVHYVDVAEDKKEAVEALELLAQVKERYTDSDVWEDEAHVIPTYMLCEMLTTIAYDLYAYRAKRISNPDVPFTYFAYDCRKYGLEELSDDALHAGYDVIRDKYIERLEEGDYEDENE